MTRHLRRLLLCGVVVACADGAADPPAASSPAGAEAPPPDHVKRLMALDLQGDERNKFFEAAGVDGELSAKEFEKAKGNPGSFVRAYENWWEARKYDLDGNDELNWPEATKYRKALQAKLRHRFDKDKNGKLIGPENDEANNYLAQRINIPGRRKVPWTIDHWDTNRNGKLDAHEEKARKDYYRREAEAKKRQDELVQWDMNKNGKLDAEEREAMESYRKEEKRRREEMLKRWDKDGDGRLSDKERYVMSRVQQATRQRHLMRRYDKNRDGKLNDKESQEVEKYYTDEYEKKERQARLRKYDKNHDGKLDARERALMEAHRRQQARDGK